MIPKWLQTFLIGLSALSATFIGLIAFGKVKKEEGKQEERAHNNRQELDARNTERQIREEVRENIAKLSDDERAARLRAYADEDNH